MHIVLQHSSDSLSILLTVCLFACLNVYLMNVKHVITLTIQYEYMHGPDGCMKVYTFRQYTHKFKYNKNIQFVLNTNENLWKLLIKSSIACAYFLFLRVNLKKLLLEFADKKKNEVSVWKKRRQHFSSDTSLYIYMNVMEYRLGCAREEENMKRRHILLLLFIHRIELLSILSMYLLPCLSTPKKKISIW